MATIYFDMDGTIADLYAIDNWLEYLLEEDITPYKEAKPLLHLSTFARAINQLQCKGYEIGIITWLSKNSSAHYENSVTITKMNWLRKHLPSVKWDKIVVLSYGTPKELYCNSEHDILFDDEVKNRESWKGIAFNEKNIMFELNKILHEKQ